AKTRDVVTLVTTSRQIFATIQVTRPGVQGATKSCGVFAGASRELNVAICGVLVSFCISKLICVAPPFLCDCTYEVTSHSQYCALVLTLTVTIAAPGTGLLFQVIPVSVQLLLLC